VVDEPAESALGGLDAALHRLLQQPPGGAGSSAGYRWSLSAALRCAAVPRSRPSARDKGKVGTTLRVCALTMHLGNRRAGAACGGGVDSTLPVAGRWRESPNYLGVRCESPGRVKCTLLRGKFAPPPRLVAISQATEPVFLEQTTEVAAIHSCRLRRVGHVAVIRLQQLLHIPPLKGRTHCGSRARHRRGGCRW